MGVAGSFVEGKIEIVVGAVSCIGPFEAAVDKVVVAKITIEAVVAEITIEEVVSTKVEAFAQADHMEATKQK